MIKVSESEVKYAVNEYLETIKAMGKLWFCRLNAGDFIEERGGSRRRIKGAGKGTADFIVIQGGEVQMFHAIQKSIHAIHPISFVTFIECKSSIGKESPEQKEFEELVTKLNCRYAIVRSVDDVIGVLNRE